MTAYQAGIAKFEGEEAQVFGISTDNTPTLKHWAEEHLKLSFPLLSDFQRKVAEAYGVLSPNGVASRTTFVIDTNGKIQHIEAGAPAIDPNGAVTACSRVRKK
ncbi:MAG: redoxin domain-containing protein [Acidobacteria bacterium]|nr:redoxin domain-containing protein [Acidobacteriota bacterium]MBI3281920.1 redoxin domain-containing protein [Acidobacteriota bacterium]